jgi:ABC-type glutathione transport system ATPase component
VSALLEIRGLTQDFPLARGLFGRRAGMRRAVDGVDVRRAVDRVDLDVQPGECVALVGESGSGKTTVARCALRLLVPTAGSVRFAGEDLAALRPAALRHLRRRFQMVFQDPQTSLDPRRRIGWSVAEPLAVHSPLTRGERAAAAAALLARVELPEALAGRFPHELSGGQRQRVGIARALATGPDLLIADEPTSALDVSVRAQILNLLADLRESLGLALLLIAHDLAAVAQLADRVAVLQAGRVVEAGPAAEVLTRPRHPYTAALLAAVPRIGGDRGEWGERNQGGMR